MESIFAVLLIATGVTVILFASAFLNAFVLSKLWLWFAESRPPEADSLYPYGAALVSSIRRPFLRTVSGLKFKR
jgi:hypothetical protein